MPDTIPDQPVDRGGATCVGLIGTILLGAYFLAAAWFSAYTLVTFWPSIDVAAAATASQAGATAVLHTRYFGSDVEHTMQQGTILIVLFAGALGALVHVLRSFYWYVGNRGLRWSWVPMYVLLPFNGALLGLLFYIVLVAGLFAGAPADGRVAGFAAIAALVGMFSSPAAEKLQDIFETIFTKRPEGKDTVKPITSTSPAIGKVTIAASPAGGQRLSVEGTGFSDPLTISLADANGTKTAASAANVTSTGFNSDVTLTPGVWSIVVTTKDGQVSPAFQFTIV